MLIFCELNYKYTQDHIFQINLTENNPSEFVATTRFASTGSLLQNLQKIEKERQVYLLTFKLQL